MISYLRIDGQEFAVYHPGIPVDVDRLRSYLGYGHRVDVISGPTDPIATIPVVDIGRMVSSWYRRTDSTTVAITAMPSGGSASTSRLGPIAQQAEVSPRPNRATRRAAKRSRGGSDRTGPA